MKRDEPCPRKPALNKHDRQEGRQRVILEIADIEGLVPVGGDKDIPPLGRMIDGRLLRGPEQVPDGRIVIAL